MTIKKVVLSLFVFIFIAQIAQLSAFTGGMSRVINRTVGKQLLNVITKRDFCKSTGQKDLLSITKQRDEGQANLHRKLLEQKDQIHALTTNLNRAEANYFYETIVTITAGAILTTTLLITCQFPYELSRSIAKKWRAFTQNTNQSDDDDKSDQDDKSNSNNS